MTESNRIIELKYKSNTELMKRVIRGLTTHYRSIDSIQDRINYGQDPYIYLSDLEKLLIQLRDDGIVKELYLPYIEDHLYKINKTALKEKTK